jgi:hypothetical protein
MRGNVTSFICENIKRLLRDKKHPERHETFCETDAALRAPEYGCGPCDLENGLVFYIRFHYLGFVTRKRVEFLFDMVFDVDIDIRGKIDGGRPFVKQDVGNVSRCDNRAFTHMTMVLVRVFAVVDENELRVYFLDNCLDFLDDIFIKGEFCVGEIAPEYFFDRVGAACPELLVFPDCKIAAGISACQDQRKDAVPPGRELVKGPAASELDIVGVSSNGKDVHF